ncbi:hypothetical protein [Streptomyces sp. G1]|uniref:hypothetical protein n=1 Tax=Streptomyces sp. G1 TaxID=361572 RepID=UPI0020305159|nr:hypothetical protein [Streptomyces sp. G1]MCM1975959.1 hypothetical protein [Streptomyces sp. G1]
MSGTGSIAEVGTPSARSRALAVLRVRSRALAVGLLPAAVAVVLVSARTTGRLAGDPWPAVTLAVCAVAAFVLLVGGIFAAVVLRASPAMTPTVPLAESAAPDLYRLVRDLADRMDVPAPSAIALTPDCDSWLEDRTHAAHRRARGRTAISGGAAGAGGPESEPGAAPVLVIGSPFLWWMRVAELRAVLAPVVAGTGPSAHPDIADARGFVRGLDAAVDVGGRRFLGWIAAPARLLLRLCRVDAAEMERGVAAAASDRAQGVDYALRIVAQEQVGLAYAGWDRLLTRVAVPAWRMGRWPAHLDAGVVSALTELSRRDRLADGFTSRLGERPACDLLDQPGAVDEAASLLAARLFHGGPAEAGPDWSPVEWAAYPEEVVDRKWRMEAARLLAALDALSAPSVPAASTVDRVLTYLADADADALAGRLSGDLAREAVPAVAAAAAGRGADALPLFPLEAPRSGRDLLADHVVALVCCAAVDSAGGEPGLDWLDGPVLLVAGVRRADLAGPVLSLVEDRDPGPLRDWLAEVGVRPEKPVRLV